jgi:hypothetical protein
MAVELSLGAVALIGPTIKACSKAYHMYTITEAFGQDYIIARRKLQGQLARLEELSGLQLQMLVEVPKPESQLSDSVVSELGSMLANFEVCQDLMKKYSETGQCYTTYLF